MNSLKLSPSYIALIQKPTCCSVTCLQMILYRNGFGLRDQEDVALDFGFSVHPDYAAAFSTAIPIMTPAEMNEGTLTVESGTRINAFLRRNASLLVATCFKGSAIVSLADFISQHLEANHDIWVEYHAREIHAGDRLKGDYIHDGLIESWNPAEGLVTLIDPVAGHRQRLSVPLATLEKAVSSHFGRETGFIVIERQS